MSFVSIFAGSILPVVSIAGVGILLGRVRPMDIRPLNTVTVYVLTPALIFHSIATTDLGGETLIKVVLGVAVFLLVMTVISEGIGRLAGETEPIKGALVLTSVFPNSGNYGIPLSEFAFGSVGRATAVLYLVGQSVIMYTLGVYLASRGNDGRSLEAIKEVFKLPLLYAVILAVIARWLGVVPPAGSTAMETVRLVGNAAIPLMLLLVGIQLADVDYGPALSRVGPTNVLKLLVAPAVGLAVAVMLGFDNPTVARVFVLECATPAAITSLILVIELSGKPSVGGITGPEYVGTAVLTTTLVSVPALTLLIAVLESDFIGAIL
jgi:predicted permease